MSVLELAEQLARSPRILIVEDDPSIVSVLTQVLAHYECEIDKASNVNDAKGLTDSRKYDLIFVDLTLPDGSGATVVKNIKTTMPTVPVLVMSDSRDWTLIEETLLLGIVTVMMKPFYLTELHNALKMFKVRVFPPTVSHPFTQAA
jgi:two-component system KDP operon response regulator KdpE